MVAEGTRRGSGDKANKNIPETCGNMTLSVPLDFLFRQRESMTKRGSKSILLSVLNGVGGELDPMKKRLVDYGLFGKQPQTNIKKFKDKQLEQLFVWGQNVSGFEIRKIDKMMAALCRALGDKSATDKNFRNSDQFAAAMNEAKVVNMIVVGRYDDAFVDVDDNNDTRGFINLAYVKFGTGKLPIISPFDHPTKDGLVESEIDGKKFRDYVLDTEGSFSITTTRSYLKDFGTGNADYQNLKMFERKSDGNKFWVAQVGSWSRDQLPGEFFASFAKDTQELLLTADRISFEYGLKDTDGRIIDDVTAVGKGGADAQLVFSGLIADDESRIRVHTTDPDLDGNTKTYITIRLIRGTFYTQRVLK